MCAPEWVGVASIGIGLGSSMLVFWRPMTAHLVRETESASLPFGRLNHRIFSHRGTVITFLFAGLATLAAGLGLLAVCTGLLD